MKQSSSRLAGMPNWGTATVVGIFAGLLYGGSKEASASVVCLHFNYRFKFVSSQEEDRFRRFVRV